MLQEKEVRALQKSYARDGKQALLNAEGYLHKHCLDWDDEHKENYQRLLRRAEICLIKSTVLLAVLEG